MKVKICGITDTHTGIKAVEFGADAIGFVFAESKRRVTVEKAKEITSSLPPNIFKVGVFVNETKDEIERIAKHVGLTHIQLHGDETADFCQSITLPVIKAFSIEANEDLKTINDYPCEYVLLDGPKGKYSGGNGHTFSWKAIEPAAINNIKIILAGGLTEANVEAGIEAIQPFMVDVSSGVETKGEKDLNKIQSFIKRAKGTRGIKNEQLYNAY